MLYFTKALSNVVLCLHKFVVILTAADRLNSRTSKQKNDQGNKIFRRRVQERFPILPRYAIDVYSGHWQVEIRKVVSAESDGNISELPTKQSMLAESQEHILSLYLKKKKIISIDNVKYKSELN